ncbi:hypothetical protein [Vibrio tapetis]|uniref:Lipoprotein n=1 Tax=Vibrio tapetis subsp. tapetis TaxID=1671868 RepID=A0A2N8ZH71_9VIBR|nr:hypothetical protein [Vibrio tapetis]SON51216.1 conserved exported protein of unknown function [Vibrio tapetis subsp. tapetis]
MKITPLLTLALVLAGCSSNDYQVVKPFASSEDIEMVQQQFAEVENLDVSDDGYISYYTWNEEGFRWNTSAIKKMSNEWACNEMIEYLQHGFVIKIGFKGKGGREEHFDLNRCTNNTDETNENKVDG